MEKNKQKSIRTENFHSPLKTIFAGKTIYIYTYLFRYSKNEVFFEYDILLIAGLRTQVWIASYCGIGCGSKEKKYEKSSTTHTIIIFFHLNKFIFNVFRAWILIHTEPKYWIRIQIKV
jgi:hypothetical protein